MAAEERRLADLEKTVAVHDQRLIAIEDDVKELTESIKSLRNAVLTFAFTVAASAITLLLAATQVVAK